MSVERMASFLNDFDEIFNEAECEECQEWTCQKISCIKRWLESEVKKYEK